MIMKEIIYHAIFILKRKHLNVLVSIQERKIEEAGLGIDLPDCMMAIGRSVLSFFATRYFLYTYIYLFYWFTTLDKGEIWWSLAYIVNVPVSMLLILGYDEKKRRMALVIKMSVGSKYINSERNKLLPRTYKIFRFE